MQELLHAKREKHRSKMVSGMDAYDCTILAPQKSSFPSCNLYAKSILCIVAAMAAVLRAVPAAGYQPYAAEKQAHQLLHWPAWMPQVWELLRVLPP